MRELSFWLIYELRSEGYGMYYFVKRFVSLFTNSVRKLTIPAFLCRSMYEVLYSSVNSHKQHFACCFYNKEEHTESIYSNGSICCFRIYECSLLLFIKSQDLLAPNCPEFKLIIVYEFRRWMLSPILISRLPVAILPTTSLGEYRRTQ